MQPKRQVDLRLNLGADSYDEAIIALEGIIHRLRVGEVKQEEQIRVTSGAPGSGYSLDVDVDYGITPEKYQQDCKDYLLMIFPWSKD